MFVACRDINPLFVGRNRHFSGNRRNKQRILEHKIAFIVYLHKDNLAEIEFSVHIAVEIHKSFTVIENIKIGNAVHNIFGRINQFTVRTACGKHDGKNRDKKKTKKFRHEYLLTYTRREALRDEETRLFFRDNP